MANEQRLTSRECGEVCLLYFIQQTSWMAAKLSKQSDIYYPSQTRGDAKYSRMSTKPMRDIMDHFQPVL